MPSSSFWNKRYAAENYAYGTSPNAFFAQQLASLSPGKMLLPCEGEGRNAVYAAGLGWQTIAVDRSNAGRLKANELANLKGVDICYVLGNCLELGYPSNRYDLVGLIYAHLPSEERKVLLQKMSGALKPGGIVVLEAFSHHQLAYESGGPKDLDWLYSLELLKEELPEFTWKLAQEEEIDLAEGEFHKGKAHVVRLVAQKVT